MPNEGNNIVKWAAKQPKTMGTQETLENHISAFEIGNSHCIQMALRAAIELDVFNIIAKSGPGAHLSSKEIVSQIPTTNPILAARNLERILNLLSVNSLLSTSLRPTLNDKTLQAKTYCLTRNSLCLVPNEDGVSLSPMLMFCSEMHQIQTFYMLKHTVLEPECSPFYKGHGLSFYEYMYKKPEMIQLFDKIMSITSYMYFDKKVLEVYRGFQELKELMDVGGGRKFNCKNSFYLSPHTWHQFQFTQYY